jgi:hypothetical protein
MKYVIAIYIWNFINNHMRHDFMPQAERQFVTFGVIFESMSSKGVPKI